MLTGPMSSEVPSGPLPGDRGDVDLCPEGNDDPPGSVHRWPAVSPGDLSCDRAFWRAWRTGGEGLRLRVSCRLRRMPSSVCLRASEAEMATGDANVTFRARGRGDPTGDLRPPTTQAIMRAHCVHSHRR